MNKNEKLNKNEKFKKMKNRTVDPANADSLNSGHDEDNETSSEVVDDFQNKQTALGTKEQVLTGKLKVGNSSLLPASRKPVRPRS